MLHGKLIQLFCVATIVILVFSANMAKAELITDGLISYWPLDKSDVVGGVAKDVWGDNHGELVGDPKVGEGQVNEGVEFDGDDYILLDDSSLPVSDGAKNSFGVG